MTAVASATTATRFPTTHYQPFLQSAGRATVYDMPDRRMSSANEGLYMPTALILRRLPLSTTAEAVRTMLLFAKDLQDTDIVPNEYDEDQGFSTAIARFSSMAGASEAQAMLDGKSNTDGQANMIVEVLPSSSYGAGFRRNTIDPSNGRPVPKPTSPRPHGGRYNAAYDPISKMSPPPATSPPEAALSDGGSGSFKGIFQAQSPRSLALQDRARVSGKSVIGEEDGDDETNGLIRDPLAYMRKDSSTNRRLNGSQMPVNAFSRLSLQTEMPVQQPPSYATPRSAMQVYSPRAPFSPGGGPYMGGHGHQFPRGHQFPPANPADQNPPCNTLYVGNLPMDTSEDELKAMFSKQRGYKRLCFRTKQNGPMCFVEFEDISFATKALNELYGAQLHNSVKGGIRLSFSKNPLGVRSGQPGSSTGPPTPLTMSGPNMLNSMSAMSPGGFSTASGPPPGLSVPPGFSPPSSTLPSQYQGAGMRNQGQGPTPDGGNMFPDYMMGR